MYQKKYLLVLLIFSIIVLSGCTAGKVANIQAEHEAQEQERLEQERIFQEAVETDDPSKCEELGSSTTMVNCITRIAYDKNDPKICSLVPGGLYRDFCTIIVTGDISDCDSESLDKVGLGDVNEASCKSIINKDKTECDIFEPRKTGHNLCLSNYNNIFS